MTTETEERTIRKIDLTPTPTGTFVIFERLLTSVAVELATTEHLSKKRKAAIIKQVAYVRDELSKWPSFLEGITWEELESLDRHAVVRKALQGLLRSIWDEEQGILVPAFPATPVIEAREALKYD